MKKFAAKKILSFIILSAFLMQALIPVTAFAGANSPLNYDNPNKSGNNPYKISLKGIITSGVLTNVVSCTGIIDKVAKVSTEFVKKVADKLKKILKIKTKAKSKEKSDAVPTSDSTNTEAVSEGGSDVQDSVDKVSFTNCLKGIAIRLAKNQLTAMTKYTMNWINSGFNGDPLYVRDVNSYMDSITTEILKKENDFLKDPNNADDYPFGREEAKNSTNIYKSAKNFKNSLASDMSDYVQGATSPADALKIYSNDFASGGWNGWIALTQDPKNNPLGSRVIYSQNLSDTTSQKLSNTKDEINRNGGVFDQKVCAKWQTVDKDNNPEYNDDGTEHTSTSGKPTDICLAWKTVTPGSVIKTKIDTYINSPERQIELANTLEEALNALFSALINKFENQGLSSLGSQVNNFTSPVDGGGFGSNNLVDSLGNSITSTTLSSGSGTNNNGNESFDITKDLGNKYVESIDSGKWDAKTNTPELASGDGIKNQYYTVSVAGDTKLFPGNYHWKVGDKAFYDGTTWEVGAPTHIIDTRGVFQIQKDYLKSSQKAATLLPQVIPKLGELDYCIPGPNQNWSDNSSPAREAYSSYLSGVTIDDVEYRIDARDYGCFAITCGIINHDYTVINLPDSSEYKDIFNDARNLWSNVTTQEFYYIIHPFHTSWTFGHNEWAVHREEAEPALKKWVDLSDKSWNEYIIKAREKFGFNSPMQSEFTVNGNPNPAYLVMSQAGLDLTKNLVEDAKKTTDAIATNDESISQSTATIYKLTSIKDKMNKIIGAAQERRKVKRAAAGLLEVPKICLDNEKVTYIEDGVIKY